MKNRFSKLSDRELAGIYLYFWSLPRNTPSNILDEERMDTLRDIRKEQSRRDLLFQKQQEQEYKEWLNSINQ